MSLIYSALALLGRENLSPILETGPSVQSTAPSPGVQEWCAEQIYMLTGPGTIDGYQAAEMLTRTKDEEADWDVQASSVARQILKPMTVPD